MNKRDVLELRRRLKKDACTITRVSGCYVDINKNKIVKLNETFLNLPDEEFYKYLDICKKTLSGTIGNNILELEFASEEEFGGKQQFFMGLRSSELKNEELLDRFYDLIIEGYESDNNYLILVFHDSYDIISRTSDNLKLDESEEVYEYLLTAICPVELSKAGLAYRQDDNTIGARIRDWVVGAPALGFLFPAFTDGSADIHKVDYFIKDAKDSNTAFIEEVIGCGPKRTKTEQRKAFTAIVKQAYAEDKEKGEEVLMELQESFKLRIEPEDEESANLSTPIILDERVIDAVLVENEIDEDAAAKIKTVCLEEFADEAPDIAALIDEKALEKSLKEKEERSLRKEISTLKQQLEETSNDSLDENTKIDVVLRCKPDKAGLIKAETINDQKYIMIPIEEDEQFKLNGVDTKL